MPEWIWDSAKINGEITYIPNFWLDTAFNDGMVTLRKDLLEKNGLEAPKSPEDLLAVAETYWEAMDLWRFYNQRCCKENYIKEAKRGFSIDKIATGSFEANEMDLLLKLLACNLYERVKHDCCEPVHSSNTIAGFRLEFFQCAATLVSHSRRVMLKLS